jgi:hypothetical protein
MGMPESAQSSRSALRKALAVGAALAAFAILGVASVMFVLAGRLSADPHGGAPIFLPALLLVVLAAAFLLAAIGVWRRSHGWQLLLAVPFALVLLIVLMVLGVI